MLLDFVANIIGSEGYVKNTFSNATNLRLLGEASRLITPNAFWSNGVTYAAGQGVDAQNNAPVIYGWKSTQEEYQSNVGVSDNFDTLRHDWPAVWVLNDYVYIFHIDGHGAEINIYRSNTAGFPENITDGFSLHHSIAGTFSYLQVDYIDSENRFQILSRYKNSGNGDKEHTQVILYSAPNDYTSWTELRTSTKLDSTYWHYPANLQLYGTNEYKYLGIIERRQPETNFFSHALYKTKDYQTYFNRDLSFYKNIVVDGPFTADELSQIKILDLAITENTGGIIIGAVVNDTVYTSYYNPSNSKWYLRKIDPAGTITDVETNFPDAITPDPGIANYIQIYYNGQNLVILTRFNKKKVYACDMNFENLQFKEDLAFDDGTNSTGLIPHRFNSITGEYIIPGGSNETIEYLITSEKYLIGVNDPTTIQIINPSEGLEIYAGDDLYATVKLS